MNAQEAKRVLEHAILNLVTAYETDYPVEITRVHYEQAGGSESNGYHKASVRVTAEVKD